MLLNELKCKPNQYKITISSKTIGLDVMLFHAITKIKRLKITNTYGILSPVISRLQCIDKWYN